MAGNYVQRQIKRGSFPRHWCLVKWWTDKTAFRKWKVLGNIQGAACFSPIRTNSVRLMAACLFPLAVLWGRTLNPPTTGTVFSLLSVPSRSVHPALPLIFLHGRPPSPLQLPCFLLSCSTSIPVFFFLFSSPANSFFLNPPPYTHTHTHSLYFLQPNQR